MNNQRLALQNRWTRWLLSTLKLRVVRYVTRVSRAAQTISSCSAIERLGPENSNSSRRRGRVGGHRRCCLCRADFNGGVAIAARWAVARKPKQRNQLPLLVDGQVFLYLRRHQVGVRRVRLYGQIERGRGVESE